MEYWNTVVRKTLSGIMGVVPIFPFFHYSNIPGKLLTQYNVGVVPIFPFFHYSNIPGSLPNK